MFMINTNSQKIQELLNRGVEEIFERESLLKKLQSGKKLRIKHGVDPTGPKIHLGRAIQFWKLRAFQELGHQIILIIGDFTAQIGDASDKQSIRKCLTPAEIKENMKDYKRQIGKILDLKKVEVCYNSQWLKKLSIRDLLNLAMHFTAQQMIQRRNFKERWEQQKPIGVHELTYPLFQGYDSVAVKSDIEIGGTDQLFNLQAGREIQKSFGQEPQDIMTLKMLRGLDGRKMSTSWGNIVTIIDESQDMYGKIMSLRDELIFEYFELCTRVAPEELAVIKKDLEENKINPRDVKAKLAKEIVALYHGKDSAEEAEKEFNRIFKEKQLPSEIKTVDMSQGAYPILDLLADTGLAASKSEAQRLVEGGGVSISIGNQESRIQNWKEEIKIEEGMVIRAGKRRFIKIHLIK